MVVEYRIKSGDMVYPFKIGYVIKTKNVVVEHMVKKEIDILDCHNKYLQSIQNVNQMHVGGVEVYTGTAVDSQHKTIECVFYFTTLNDGGAGQRAVGAFNQPSGPRVGVWGGDSF